MQDLSTIKAAMAALMEIHQIKLINDNEYISSLDANQTLNQVKVTFNIDPGYIVINSEKYTRNDVFNCNLLKPLSNEWFDTLTNMGYNIKSTSITLVNVGLVIIAKLNKEKG